MKTHVIMTAAMAALVCGPVFAHHPAEDMVDPEIYQMINDRLEAADSPHLDMDMDDMGANMEEAAERSQDRAEQAAGMIDAAQERAQMSEEQTDAARERAETASQRSSEAMERTENASNRGDNVRDRTENAENRYDGRILDGSLFQNRNSGERAEERLDLEATIRVIE
jgi:hypothetical protein